MDKQIAYDRIKAHFSKPGAQFAFNEKERSCYYRIDYKPYSNRKCAIGCLIPDKRYAALKVADADGAYGLEGMDPREVTKWLWPKDASEDLWEFLAVCQNLHDYTAMRRGAEGNTNYYKSVATPGGGELRLSGDSIGSFLFDLKRFAKSQGLNV